MAHAYPARPTLAGGDADSTIAIERPATLVSEAATMAYVPDGRTAMAEAATIADADPEFTESRTAILSPSDEIDAQERPGYETRS